MNEEEIRNHLYDVYAGEDWDFLTNYIMKLQQENRQLKEDLKYVLEQTLGAFIQNWCIDWNFTDIRDKYSISDTYEWNSGKNE